MKTHQRILSFVRSIFNKNNPNLVKASYDGGKTFVTLDKRYLRAERGHIETWDTSADWVKYYDGNVQVRDDNLVMRELKS